MALEYKNSSINPSREDDEKPKKNYTKSYLLLLLSYTNVML